MIDVLPDGLWEIVQPLLPPVPKTGRPRADQRAVLTTVLFVQASGCSWEKAHGLFGVTPAADLRDLRGQRQRHRSTPAPGLGHPGGADASRSPAAGALPPPRREAAFRSLTAEWPRRGGADLAADWKLLLSDVPDAGELARSVRDELLARGEAPPAPVAPEEVTDFPERAPLRMVSYTAEHTDGRVRREAETVVHLAVPGPEADGPWRMRVLTATGPVRLRVRTGAFDGTGRARVDRGGGGREVFAVDGDALCVDARAWVQETPPR
ncbi:transposase [Nocardiopsis dassonvillei]|uniref:transposase n=1 Tax=Nocardiopsis dassonvillei TaxID=2014 RepID=UPI000B9D56D6|nr:hypothetical protein CGQ36_11855 [Nocardiopsis dassonvillei]